MTLENQDSSTQSNVPLLPQLTFGSLEKLAAVHGIELRPNGKPFKLEVYDAFLEFCATPPHLRLPDELTVEEFAKKHAVAERTLYRYANRPTFQAEVRVRRKGWGFARVQDVLSRLYKRCMEFGMHKDIALYLEYFDDWTSKTAAGAKGNSGIGGEEFTMDDIRHLITFLPPEKQKKFNDTIVAIIQEAVEYARVASENGLDADGL